MTIRPLPAVLGFVAAAWQGAPPSPATVVVSYASIAFRQLDAPASLAFVERIESQLRPVQVG
jgi:hypothetical protein